MPNHACMQVAKRQLDSPVSVPLYYSQKEATLAGAAAAEVSMRAGAVQAFV